MRKVIPYIIVILAVFISGVSYAGTPMRKFGRGLANILTCPAEIVKSAGEVNYKDGPVAALTYGIVKGFYRAGRRLLVGGFELVTFFSPYPGDYEPIINDPEFFLSDGIL